MLTGEQMSVNEEEGSDLAEPSLEGTGRVDYREPPSHKPVPSESSVTFQTQDPGSGPGPDPAPASCSLQPACKETVYAAPRLAD